MPDGVELSSFRPFRGGGKQALKKEGETATANLPILVMLCLVVAFVPGARAGTRRSA
jgi:hypothetical protein